MDEKDFNAILGRYVLAQYGVETWHNARSSVLFMRDNNPARPLQVRVEVISGYQPVVYTGLSTEALIT